MARPAHTDGRRAATAVTGSARRLADALFARGIVLRCGSGHGIAEEAPGACKDVTAVGAAEQAGMARIVGRLKPLVCIKG